MNATELPSSVYQSGEQDYGLWPEDRFPTTKLEVATEQQDANSYISFSDSLDFGPYSDSQWMSDFSDPLTAWDEQTMPIAHDMTGIQSTQEETHRLRVENAELRRSVENNAKRVGEMETQFNAFQQWTAMVSSVLNDIQLRQQGLSPLQKHFGRIMSPPTAKGKKTRMQEGKHEAERIKARKILEK